jgi:hypothetical protein
MVLAEEEELDLHHLVEKSHWVASVDLVFRQVPLVTSECEQTLKVRLASVEAEQK